MELRGAQKAQGVALAGHRTGPASYRGLDVGQPTMRPCAASGSRYRCITVGIAGSLPTSGRPTTALAARPCPKGKGRTSIVEAITCSLRQRCGVLVRKSCSFSKSLAMHTARIKIVIDNYNRNIILD